MNRPRPGKWKSLYLWHRYTGIVSAALVLVLAVSGLLLQHSDALELDRRYVDQHWLLDWYGVDAVSVVSYRAGDYWVSQAGETLYINGIAANGRYGELKGAVQTKFGVAAVVGDKLVLFTEHGWLIETLTGDEGLPEPAVAITGDPIVLRGSNTLWKPDDELLRWRPYDGPKPDWTRPSAAPTNLLERVRRHNRNHRIHWERFLLDLHSGRIFGRYGRLAMDVAAVALIALACSGLWVWVQRRRKDREHRR